MWDNSLASEKPIYNADFTEMTVKLRSGIYWSDGVEFTSDDVLYTIQTHMKTNGLRWSAAVQVNVADITAPDKNTVVFKLKKPNSRFHALFTVRWNAMWMMPKHVFEKAGDLMKFAFDPPVSLGPYTLKSYDPNGKWFIWQKREDWKRTTVARFGEPGPKYVAYVDPGPPDKRVIAQLNHELDIIHDTSPEGMFTLAKQSKSSHGWFKTFPYAHPDPTLPMVIFNHQNDMFKSRDARWALALLIDIKAVSMASYRGAATISAIGVPPTGTHPEYYHDPMEAWLQGLRDRYGQAQDQALRPHRRQADRRHAASLAGRSDSDRPRDHRQVVRARLVEARSAGRHRAAAARWLHQAGQRVVRPPMASRFTIRITVEGELRPVMTRAGSMIAQQWRQFGIDATTVVAQGSLVDRRNAGDFEVIISWSRRDLGRPSRPVVLPRQLAFAVRCRAGKDAAAAQLEPLVAPELDKIIEQIRGIGFDDPEGHRARPGLREAGGARDADHPADGLQRVHGDG